MTEKLSTKHSCGGDLVRDHGAYQCLGCSKKWVTNSEKRKFFEEFKPLIQSDLLKFGRHRTLKLWHLPESTFTHLIQRWERDASSQSPPPPVASSNGSQPKLPPFSQEWDKTVQVKWLEVYQLLTLRGKTEVTGAKPTN